MDSLTKLTLNNKLDPTEFDLTVGTVLIGLGAEKYMDIFRKHNIGQCTLMELTAEDLIKLGVDDVDIRNKLMEEVKNLPIYEETLVEEGIRSSRLGPIEIGDLLQETSQHLHRVYLSMLSNTVALKKHKNISDCLLYKNKYASDIALATLNEISDLLNFMEFSVQTKFKVHLQESEKSKNKKIIVGAVGSASIIILGYLFLQSLKRL